MKHYTTIEQSRKLFELGLDSDTADMIWTTDMADNFFDYPTLDWRPIKEYINGKDNLPCWSLGALLEVMPDRIWGPCDDYDEPCAHELVFKAFGSTIEYEGILVSDYRLSSAWFKQETDNLIDIFYDMVVWLLENGYIKKGE